MIKQSPDRDIDDNQAAATQTRNGSDHAGDIVTDGNGKGSKQGQKQTTKDTDPRRGKQDKQHWSSLIQAAMSVATVLLTVFLFSAARDANLVAAKTAEVAQQAVNLASNTAQTELRAYVFAVDARVIRNRVTLTVRNSGKTPAFNTFIDSKACWGEDHMLCGAYLAKGETATLAPGEEFTREHEIDPSMFRKGEVLHVHGGITYVDVFDKEQVFPFHYIQKERTATSMSAVSTD